ncbi:MAG: hypothetical protein ACLTMP_05550 [Eggerthella lenta]
MRDALERTRRFFGERSILFDASDDATPGDERRAYTDGAAVVSLLLRGPYMVRLRHLLVISQFEARRGASTASCSSSSPCAAAHHLRASWRRAVRPRRRAQMAVELQGARSCSCMRV